MRHRFIRLWGVLAWMVASLVHMPAAAVEKGFASAADFIAEMPDAVPGQSRTAKGDLNGDGRDDWVVLLLTRQRDDIGVSRLTQRLVVLVERPGGRLYVGAQSAQEIEAGKECCWVETLDVRRGNIVIQVNAKTDCQVEATTHQFRQVRSAWRLVALTSYSYQHCAGPRITRTREFNPPTGRMVYTRDVEGGRRTSRTTMRAPSLVLLREFDFSTGFGSPRN